MADTSSPSAARDQPGSAAARGAGDALRKGSLVRLQLQAYRGILEAAASDAEVPGYVVEGPGEILVVKGEHAQIRWRRPVPDVWLRLDQLEAWQP